MALSDHIPWLKQKFDDNQAIDADVRELQEWVKTFACRVAVGAFVISALSISGTTAVALYKQPPARELLTLNGNATVSVYPEWDGDLSVLGNQKLRAMTEQYLDSYARACEGYFWGNFKDDEERCASMSSDKVNRERGQRLEVTNPDSPVTKYSDGTTVRIDVLSRIPQDPEANPPTRWRLRMIKWTRQRGTGEEKPSTWEADAVVGYGKPPKKAEHRRHNRMGFLVAEWRVYPEASPAMARQVVSP